jgi:putative SOS response-associated peptidase YedK
MCYHTQQLTSKENLEKRLNGKVIKPELFLQSDVINGFTYPNIPIVLNSNFDEIVTDFSWGLLPIWAKDATFRKNTLNAKVETISEKPSFKNNLNNRCLIAATSFFEWRWLDEKGKKKQKYQIFTEDETFCFAGLFDIHLDAVSGKEIKTFTMLTTVANETMQFIHNHKKRMPIILDKKDEQNWLEGLHPIADYAFPYSSKLIAFEVD